MVKRYSNRWRISSHSPGLIRLKKGKLWPNKVWLNKKSWPGSAETQSRLLWWAGTVAFGWGQLAAVHCCNQSIRAHHGSLSSESIENALMGETWLPWLAANENNNSLILCGEKKGNKYWFLKRAEFGFGTSPFGNLVCCYSLACQPFSELLSLKLIRTLCLSHRLIIERRENS